MGAGGGVERGTVEIAGAIVARGGRALVASNGGASVHELKRVKAEHIEMPVHSKNPFVMIANIWRLEKLIRDEGVDIVHARSRAPAWSGYWATKRISGRFITTYHGAYSEGLPGKRLYNSVMAKGDPVIAISNFIAAHVQERHGVPPERIEVIPRGAEHPEAAWAFVRFATGTPALTAFAERIAYGPARASAARLVRRHPEAGIDMRPHIPTHPYNSRNAIAMDEAWYARTLDRIRHRFEAWVGE